MSRQFTASKGIRKRVPLLIGLYGPSGGGKTFSALRLATGIRSVVGGEIWVIDTEGDRALHYAPTAGEQPDPRAGTFDFRHVPFVPPFRSLDYAAAISHCIANGARVIVIDSQSHEHEGEGGLLEAHEAELDRLAGSDWQKRDRCKMLAWARPKADRRKMRQAVMQATGVIFVFCFRAKEKIKLVKGKKEPVQLGWQPIGDPALAFEMTVRGLLLPCADGHPEWRPDLRAEQAMVKRPGWSKEMFSKQLDEETGAKLARWAEGSTASAVPPVQASDGDSYFARERKKDEAPGMPESAIALLAKYQAVTTLDEYTIAEDERRDLWPHLDGVAKAALKGESVAAFARVEADDTLPAPETT